MLSETAINVVHAMKATKVAVMSADLPMVGFQFSLQKRRLKEVIYCPPKKRGKP
jgi:hypothetical protein